MGCFTSKHIKEHHINTGSVAFIIINVSKQTVSGGRYYCIITPVFRHTCPRVMSSAASPEPKAEGGHYPNLQYTPLPSAPNQRSSRSSLTSPDTVIKTTPPSIEQRLIACFTDAAFVTISAPSRPRTAMAEFHRRWIPTSHCPRPPSDLSMNFLREKQSHHLEGLPSSVLKTFSATLCPVSWRSWVRYCRIWSVTHNTYTGLWNTHTYRHTGRQRERPTSGIHNRGNGYVCRSCPEILVALLHSSDTLM